MMDTSKTVPQLLIGFYKSGGIDHESIDQIERAIAATKVPQSPTDVISKVLCDADLMHLSFDDYQDRMELLRREWELCGRSILSEKEFLEQSVKFFETHHYHTSYGLEVLTPKKMHNLEGIKSLI